MKKSCSLAADECDLERIGGCSMWHEHEKESSVSIPAVEISDSEAAGAVEAEST